MTMEVELSEALTEKIRIFERHHTEPDAVGFLAFSALRAAFKAERLDVCDHIIDKTTQRVIGICCLEQGRSALRMRQLAESRWAIDSSSFVDLFGFRRTMSQRFIDELWGWEVHTRTSNLSWSDAFDLIQSKAQYRRNQRHAPVASSIDTIKRERVALGPRWVPMDIKDAREEHDQQCRMLNPENQDSSNDTTRRKICSVSVGARAKTKSNIDSVLATEDRGSKTNPPPNSQDPQKGDTMPHHPARSASPETGDENIDIKPYVSYQDRAHDEAPAKVLIPLSENINKARRKHLSSARLTVKTASISIEDVLAGRSSPPALRPKRKLSSIEEESSSRFPEPTKRQHFQVEVAKPDRQDDPPDSGNNVRKSIEDTGLDVSEIEVGRYGERALSDRLSDFEDLIIPGDHSDYLNNNDNGYYDNCHDNQDDYEDGSYNEEEDGQLQNFLSAQQASSPPMRIIEIAASELDGAMPQKLAVEELTIDSLHPTDAVAEQQSAVDASAFSLAAARLEKPNAWLSDEHIFLVLNTFALSGWQLLQHLEPPDCTSWSEYAADRRAKGRKVHIHPETSHILIPVLRPGHWVLFCFDLAEHTARLYDSCPSLWQAASEAKAAVAYALIQMITLSSNPPEEQWNFEESSEVVHQEDQHSCGDHVLLNALCIMYNVVRESHSMPLWRILLSVFLRNDLLSEAQMVDTLRSLTSLDTIGTMQQIMSSSAPADRPLADDPLSLIGRTQRLLDACTTQSLGQGIFGYETAHRLIDTIHAKIDRENHRAAKELQGLRGRIKAYQTQISGIESASAALSKAKGNSRSKAMRLSQRKVLEEYRQLLLEDTQLYNRLQKRFEDDGSRSGGERNRAETGAALMLKQLEVLRDAFKKQKLKMIELAAQAKEGLSAYSKFLRGSER